MGSPDRSDALFSGPLFRTLEEILRVLRAHGTRFALAGGLAQQVWGRVRSTRDVDLLISMPDDLSSLLAAFAARAIHASGEPRRLGDLEFHSLSREDPEAFVDVPVDLLVARGGLGEQAVRRAISLPIGSLVVPVVSAEDLLLLKLLADRILDRVDAEDIAREQSGRLDLAYLKEGAGNLGLTDQLTDLLDRVR
ncbi:MAG: nucleotidyl transferase AbiEii/AbiGii toxin family protein [Planctomycetota bacterium]|jgi:predicted nucleotidyltransferase